MKLDEGGNINATVSEMRHQAESCYRRLDHAPLLCGSGDRL